MSYLDYSNYSEIVNEIHENLEDVNDKELDYKFSDLTHIINDIINMKYYKW